MTDGAPRKKKSERERMNRCRDENREILPKKALARLFTDLLPRFFKASLVAAGEKRKSKKLKKLRIAFV